VLLLILSINNLPFVEIEVRKMSTFSKHDLFGGAITVDLPQDYIDARYV